jgi:hypothetical protein
MPDDETGRESPAAEKPAAADGQTPEPDDPPEQSAVVERGPRPRIRAGQPIGGYTRQELAALARWVESDGRARTEAEAITEIAHELNLPDRAPRAEDSLRHAVRVARAGAPPLWPDEFETPPKDEAEGAEAEPGSEPETESETTD